MMEYSTNLIISDETLKEMKEHGIAPEQRLVLSVKFSDGKIMDFAVEAEAYDEINDISFYLLLSKEDKFQILSEQHIDDFENADFDIIFGSWILKFQDDIYVLNITEGMQTEKVICYYDYDYGISKNNQWFRADRTHCIQYDSDAERARKKAAAEETAFWKDKSYLPDADCLTFGMAELLKK